MMGEAKRAKHNPNGKGKGEMWVEKMVLLKKEGVNALTEIQAKAREVQGSNVPESFVDFLAYCIYTGADMVSRATQASANVLIRTPTAEDMAHIRKQWEGDVTGGAYVGRRSR
jgi:hypothetical protein